MLVRKNFNFNKASDHEISEEFQHRVDAMRSKIARAAASLLITNREEFLSSEELEEALNIPRATLLTLINNLRCIHGFRIINVESKGRPAVYQLVAFDVPIGRNHTKKKKSQEIVKTTTHDTAIFSHPLINKIFN